MSLTMMALRMAAVEALKSGDTLVGDNVLDSEISAIDLTADGALSSAQKTPFIAVYTDAAKAQKLGNTGLRSNGHVEIVFNYGVSMAMAETNKVTGEKTIVEGLPATDEHFEALLDVLEVQIGRALTDPDNPWAQAFGGFICGYVAKEHLRSSTAQKVRLAAGQTRLTVNAFADPRHGQPLADDGPWPRLMALMEKHAHPQLPLIRQMLGEESDGLYAEFERLTGMTSRDAQTLRLYTYGRVPRDVRITKARSEVTR